MNFSTVTREILYQTQTGKNSTMQFEFYHLFQIVIELFVLIGNLFLIVLISANKTLYTNNNTTKIVLSLSITDLMLSILVMPFTFYLQVNNSVWNLGPRLCILWLSSDLHLTTTSIFHLCALSYERYLGVAEPIKFRKKLRQRVTLLIMSGWMLSFALVTLPFLVLSFLNKNYFHSSNVCGYNHNSFIIYTTLITFWLPLVMMIFYGVKAMRIIKKIDTMHQRKQTVKLINVTRRIMELNDLKKRNNNVDTEIDVEREKAVENIVDKVVAPRAAVSQNLSRFRMAIKRNMVHTRKEMQAQNTLKIVLVVFVVSYFPIFTYITTTSLMDMFVPVKDSGHLIRYFNVTELHLRSSVAENDAFDLRKYVLDAIFYLTTWIGYSSAAMNPLIHLFLNKNFKNVLISYFKKTNSKSNNDT